MGLDTKRDELAVRLERAILVSVALPDRPFLGDDPLEELRGLATTAGAVVVGELTQKRQHIVPGTYIGKGKVDELFEIVQAEDADVVIFDNDLSPSQGRSLEKTLNVKVLDRSELILDIFASRARTVEARLQVELAQLEYSLPRLRKMWTHLSRYSGGGIGMRGPGETQLEEDRRLVDSRIRDLKQKLVAVQARKERAVASRNEEHTVSLVGYTNAGKSTLMNALTKAGVLAEDRLFATLDTRTAQLFLDRFHNVVLSDTVGFIRNLPHTLIASFHATLAEVREADLLLHVVDASSSVMESQIAAVEEVLVTIGAEGVPVIMVFNKVDRCYSKTILLAYRRRYKQSVAISALTGEGLDQLKELIKANIASRSRQVQVRFPLTDGALDAFVRSRAQVTSEAYEDDQAVLTIDADDRLLAELKANPHLVVC